MFFCPVRTGYTGYGSGAGREGVFDFNDVDYLLGSLFQIYHHHCLAMLPCQLYGKGTCPHR
jgi:hypothetical protein